MKKHLFVALALSAVLATTLCAQTTAPSDYTNSSLPEAQRLVLARTAQAALTPASAPADIEMVNSQLDYLLLDTAANWSDVQTLVEGLISSKGAYLTGDQAAYMLPDRRDDLFLQAVRTKNHLVFQAPSDRAAYLLTVTDTLTASDSDRLFNTLNIYYLSEVTWSAVDMIHAGQYDAAIALSLQPALINAPTLVNNTLINVLYAKTLTHAADVLAWAKLNYMMADFSRVQDSTMRVANAFRALDGNVARANAFIAAQRDATVANPLASVEVPDAFKGGTLPEPSYRALNLLLRGDKVNALKTVRADFDAPSDPAAFNAAVNRMAALLRAIDLNLVRANAFVAAQKTKQSYPITELQ